MPRHVVGRAQKRIAHATHLVAAKAAIGLVRVNGRRSTRLGIAGRVQRTRVDIVMPYAEVDVVCKRVELRHDPRPHWFTCASAKGTTRRA